MKGNLISIFVGILIAVGSWVPLWIVEAYDRYAMPVGLGLFAFAASFVGGVMVLVGLIRLVIQASRNSKPSEEA
jgi:zinc transporter ZupT